MISDSFKIVPCVERDRSDFYQRRGLLRNFKDDVSAKVWVKWRFWNFDLLYLPKFKSYVYVLLQELNYRILSVPGKKFDSQPPSVFKLILLPTPYCYGLNIKWNSCTERRRKLRAVLVIEGSQSDLSLNTGHDYFHYIDSFSFTYLTCLLRRRYLAFNIIDFDSLRSACQISKSKQKIRGSGQTSTIKISYKSQVGRASSICLFNNNGFW